MATWSEEQSSVQRTTPQVHVPPRTCPQCLRRVPRLYTCGRAKTGEVVRLCDRCERIEATLRMELAEREWRSKRG